MFAGDLLEATIMMTFSFGFETDKTNEFGKFIYVNISRLRDISYHDLSDWFKKGEDLFQPFELKDFKSLLDNETYLSDLDNKNRIMNQNKPVLQELISKMIKDKFDHLIQGKVKHLTL